MLVLERRIDEAIIIDTSDGRIEIVITGMRAGRVKIAVGAPRACRIIRKELLAAPAANPVELPQGCGTPGKDLECVACGRKLYDRPVQDVCPHMHGKRE